jgi:hypothetical protein
VTPPQWPNRRPTLANTTGKASGVPRQKIRVGACSSAVKNATARSGFFQTKLCDFKVQRGGAEDAEEEASFWFETQLTR